MLNKNDLLDIDSSETQTIKSFISIWSHRDGKYIAINIELRTAISIEKKLQVFVSVCKGYVICFRVEFL